jgi:hypothetical protein
VDALGTLGIALAGGSAGVVITLALGVPEQVKHHDRQVSEWDADLAQWVADEMVRLERACEGARNEHASRGLRESGAYLRAVAHLKEAALHAYRDQEILAERNRAAVRDAEGVRHRVWRKLRRIGELRQLQTPTRAKPLLDLWRHDVEGMDVSVPVSDPTKRSLQWALDKYVTEKTRASGWPEL